MSISQKELKSVRELRTKKGRRTAGKYIAEGVRLLDEAYRHQAWPERLYSAPSTLSARGLDLVEKFQSRGTDIVTVSVKELARMADASTPQGILGVFNTPRVALRELYYPKIRNILLCENMADPGNVGTLCRSALAFGFELAALCGSCAEPYAPKTVRSSVGALFSLRIAMTSAAEVLEIVRKNRFVIVAADVQGTDKFEWVLPRIKRRKLVLALGSEADGLSREVRQSCDFIVRINTTPGVESLNTAIAGSILMKERYDSLHRRSK